MARSKLTRTSLSALIVGLAACGAGDRPAPLAPTSVENRRPTGATPVAADPGVFMPVTSQGDPPAGFKAFFLVDPRPDADGIIRGSSPLTVRFDLCRSRTDPDKALSYRFDWDFDHVADVVGSGEACQQDHTYDVRRLPDARGNVLFETNVCVVSGDPRTPHEPGTYYSCRAFKVRLPVPAQGGVPGQFLHHTGYGQQWTDNVPTGTYNLAQATRACQEYVAGVSPGADSCNTTGCGCSGGDECTYNTASGGGQIRRVWFYTGVFVGQTTDNSCSQGLAWD